MELTKQRKMLIGVLGMGLLGLVVDRFVLAPPDSASADEYEEVEPDVAAPPPLAPLTAGQPDPAPADNAEAGDQLPSYASLTERLLIAQQRQASTSETTPDDPAARDDPFALPEQWEADKTKPTFEEPKQPSNGETDSRFTAIFKLDGTVRSLNGEKVELMAVISGGGLNSRAVRIGHKLRLKAEDGQVLEYELIEVGARYVVWISHSTEKRILMQVEEVL